MYGTRKVHPDDDDDKAIPWIAASKSSDQKMYIQVEKFILKSLTFYGTTCLRITPSQDDILYYSMKAQ